MRLRFHPAALAELEEAADYLESQREGFGALFFHEVTQRIAQAARWPRSGSPVVGFTQPRDVRQFVLTRYRYAIITAVVRGERLVVAVAHTSRQPGFWRDRLR